MKKSILIMMLITLFYTINVFGALSDGMIGCYDFETSDNLGDNIAQAGVDGSITGTITQVSGKVGNAGDWESTGDADYIDISNLYANGFNPDNAFTICGWMNMESTGADRWLSGVSKAGSTGDYSGQFFINSGNKFRVDTTRGNSNAVDTLLAPNVATWYFMCYSVDDGMRVRNPYVSGTFYSNATTNTLTPSGWDKFIIGGLWYNTAIASVMDGQVDEVMVWNRSISTSEIVQVYNSGTGKACTDIIIPPTKSIIIATTITNNSKIGFLDSPDGNYTFNVTASLSGGASGILNISFYVDNILNQSLTNIDLSAGKKKSIGYVFTGQETARTFKINASNSDDGTSSSVIRSLYFDGVYPEISINMTNGTTLYRNHSGNLAVQIQSADNNLYAVNYSLRKSTGALMWRYSKQSLSGTTHIYDFRRNINNESAGTYYLRLEAWDDHTAPNPTTPKVDLYPGLIRIDDEIDLFGWGDTLKGGVNKNNKPYTEFWLADDRYKFKVTWKTDSKYHSLIINSSGGLEFRSDSSYLCHFVHFDKKRWIDFQGKNIKTCQVTPLQGNAYLMEFELYQSSDEVEFESIGDLNLKNVTYTFHFTNPIYIKAIDTITSVDIDSFSLKVYNATSQINYSTTDGTAEVINFGTYTYNISSVGYIPQSQSLVLSSNQTYTFNLTASQSLYMFFYDEETDKLITQDVRVEVVNYANASYNYTTSTGSTFVSGFSPGDYELRFESVGYQPRLYYVKIATDVTQTLSLYLLNKSSGSIHNIEVVDDSASPLGNATIYMQKHFVSCNCFRTMEMAKTNEQGNTFVFAKLYTTPYKFLVYYDGILRLATDTIRLDTRNLYLKANLLTNPLDNFWASLGIQTSLGISGQQWSYTWSDTTGRVTSGNLVVRRLTTYGEDVIYNSSQSSFSGTLTYNQSSYNELPGTFIADGSVLYGADVYLLETRSFSYTTDYQYYGMNGVFLTMIILLVIAGVGAFNPAVSIAMLLLGLVVTSMMGIVYIQVTWLVGMIVVGIIFMMMIDT